MSSAQLDKIIADVVATFGAWGPQTTLHEMRKGWDDLFSDVKPTVGAKAEKVDAGGVKAEWITAPGASVDRAILYLHGGGYVLGSIHSHRDMCERLSRAAQVRVLALDYRLAPEHPFPAAVGDARAAADPGGITRDAARRRRTHRGQGEAGRRRSRARRVEGADSRLADLRQPSRRRREGDPEDRRFCTQAHELSSRPKREREFDRGAAVDDERVSRQVAGEV